MTTAFALLGLALLITPTARPAARRLAADPVAIARSARLRPPRLADLAGPTGRPLTLAAGMTAGLLVSAIAGVAAGLGALVGVASTARFMAAFAARREAGQAEEALLEAVGGLAAEVRAGRSPPAALHAAAALAQGPVSAVLLDAASVAELGGDVGAVITQVIASDPSSRPPHRHAPTDVGGGRASSLRAGPLCDGMLTLAAAWRISSRSGAALSAVLDRVEHDLRSTRQHRQRVAAELAGPRTTAMLLACLPVLGLILGAGMGAHPVNVLLHAGLGQVALILGVVLDGVGIWWTDRIVRSAETAA